VYLWLINERVSFYLVLMSLQVSFLTIFSRQQTFFVFHPQTRTFEPITIAKFLEQPAFEEVNVLRLNRYVPVP
jgi:hypothetical protein